MIDDDEAPDGHHWEYEVIHRFYERRDEVPEWRMPTRYLTVRSKAEAHHAADQWNRNAINMEYVVVRRLMADYPPQTEWHIDDSYQPAVRFGGDPR